MKKLLLFFLIIFSFLERAGPKIKDIISFKGLLDTLFLIGYGIVVGLNCADNNLKNFGFTAKKLTTFLGKLWVNFKGYVLKTKNIAVVTFIARILLFFRAGLKLSLYLSAIMDAKSLKGGRLLAKLSLGADGELYALARDFISSRVKYEENKISFINTAAGYIKNGAIIEKEIGFEFNNLDNIHLALKNPDTNTACSIEIVTNIMMRANVSAMKEPGAIMLTVPANYKGNVTGMIADTENILLSKPCTEIAIMKEKAKLSDLTESLNSLGIKPKDLVAVFKEGKQAGVLQAGMEIR